MRNATLVGFFLLADILIAITVYTSKQMDSLIIPLITVLSAFLNTLLLYLLLQNSSQRSIVLYGPHNELPSTIASPPKTDSQTSTTR